jgi:hypothetical protein
MRIHALLLTALLSGTHASAPPPDALINRDRPVLWSTSVARTGATMPEIPECAVVACTRFDLRVDLPPNTWLEGQGGVQIGIRWLGYGNNLRLYIYQDGH